MGNGTHEKGLKDEGLGFGLDSSPRAAFAHTLQNCETTIDLIKVCLLSLELSYSLTGEFCELLRVELGHLGGESHLSEHSLHVGLVDQGGEPTVNVLEGLPKQLNVIVKL